MSLGQKANAVELIDHDASWESLANETIQRLRKIFGAAAKDIQHIGSTAINGIKAKPIIDIAVAVDSFDQLEPLIPELERSGFSYRGWFLPERITVLNVYRQSDSGSRVVTHHVHVTKLDSSDWTSHINFRDYLNAHPFAAKEYEAVKVKLAADNPLDEGRTKYNAGKNEFILKTLDAAAAWRRGKAPDCDFWAAIDKVVAG